jgi:hypothetical protein
MKKIKHSPKYVGLESDKIYNLLFLSDDVMILYNSIR